jgi:hypothetical protein
VERVRRSSHVDDVRPPSADDAIEALPESLRGRLAALAGAPVEAVEAAIGLFPYGHRALLEAFRLTNTRTPTAVGEAAVEQVQDAQQRIDLTPLGRAVVEALAQRSIDVPSDEELEAQIRDVREQLVAAVTEDMWPRVAGPHATAPVEHS